MMIDSESESTWGFRSCLRLTMNLRFVTSPLCQEYMLQLVDVFAWLLSSHFPKVMLCLSVAKNTALCDWRACHLLIAASFHFTEFVGIIIFEIFISAHNYGIDSLMIDQTLAKQTPTA